MIAFPKPVSSDISDWHDWFLSMLPRIVQQAKIAFRGLDAAAMEDAIAEVVVNACVASARLVELGKTEFAFASVLAQYGVAQFRDGRSVGNRLNIHDVLSKYAQQKKASESKDSITITRKKASGSKRLFKTRDPRQCPTS